MFVQHFINMCAAFHELSWSQTFFALSGNGKQSDNPVL